MMTVPAGAASVGDPETQGQGKVSAAIDWSYIFDRKLNFVKATRPPGHSIDEPLNFKIDGGYNLAGRASYGLFEFMDVYIKLGVAQYNLKGDVFVRGKKTVEEKLRARSAFLYGGGFKVAHEFKGGWIAGCDAQYLTSNHEMDFRATSMATGALTSAKYYDCRIQEWHAAPYIAKKIEDLTLYAGGRYSDFRLNQREPSDPRRWNDLIFDSDRNIGVFTGMAWNHKDRFKLSVEGAFIDETSISVSAAYRF